MVLLASSPILFRIFLDWECAKNFHFHSNNQLREGGQCPSWIGYNLWKLLWKNCSFISPDLESLSLVFGSVPHRGELV
jgi:hypothetical protein